MYILMVCASSSAIDGLLPNLLANIKRRDARYSTNLTTVGSDWVTDVTYKFVSWVAIKRQQIIDGRKGNRKFQGFLMGIEMRRITESLFKTQPLQQKLF